jgi:hypothetical protein
VNANYSTAYQTWRGTNVDLTSGSHVSNPGGFPKTPVGGHWDGMQVAQLVDVKENDEIRVTISWDACTLEPLGSPAWVKTDFDLLLIDPTSNVVAYSASYADNNEGFQVTAGSDGNYNVWVIWDTTAESCNAGDEPLGYAYVFGSQFDNGPQ